MALSTDIFQLGLFITGLIWGDRESNQTDYKNIEEMVKLLLEKTKNQDFLKRQYQEIIKSNPNENPLERMERISENVKIVSTNLLKSIEGKFGDKAKWLFQAGFDLGNLAFVSSFIIESPDPENHLNATEGYIKNLKLSSTGIGNPPILEDFIKSCELSLKDHNFFKEIPQKANFCGQQLSIWIENNVDDIEKNDLIDVIPKFLEGIPYVGIGLAKTYEVHRKKKKKNKNLIDKYNSLVNAKLNEMKVGEKLCLKEIFGEDWEKIGDSGVRKEFGKKFKKDVENGKYPNIKWVGIRNNGRCDKYEKVI